MRSLLPTAFLATCLLLIPLDTPALEVGEPLPRFKLLDLDGRVHTENTHKGHVLILYFFGHD